MSKAFLPDQIPRLNRREICLAATGSLLGGAHHASAQSRVAGVTDASIELAAIIDLSGPLATQSRVGFAGAQLYFNNLNASGGLHGRSVNLRLLDDGFDPDQSLNLAATLHKNQSALAVFGSVGDGAASALVPLMERLKFPYFGPVTGLSDLRKARKYTFFFRPSYKTEALGILRHALAVGNTSVAFVYQKNSFGLAILEEVKHAAERLSGLHLASTIGVDDGDENLRIAAHQIASSGSKAIVIGAVGSAFVGIVQSLKKQIPGAPQLYGFSVVSPQEIFDHLGSSGRGVIISQCMPSLSKSAVPLVNGYRAAHLGANLPFPPNSFTFEGYAMAKLFAEALRSAGRSLTQERLVQALESMQSFSLDGFRISIRKDDRTASSFVDLAIVDQYGRLQY